MSCQEFVWATKQKTDGPLDKLVLLFMGDGCDMDGSYMVRLDRLADRADSTPKDVEKALWRLQAQGLVTGLKRDWPVEGLIRLNVD